MSEKREIFSPPRYVGHDYATFIRTMRFLAGWDQKEMAAKLEVEQQTIHRWEKGNIPNSTNRKKIAAYFGLSSEEEKQLVGLVKWEHTTAIDYAALRAQMIGAFITRAAQGPAMSDTEVSLARELLGLNEPAAQL